MLVSELDMIERSFHKWSRRGKSRALDNAKITARGKTKRDCDEAYLSRVRDDSMSFFTPKTGSTAESAPKHTVDPRLQPWVEK